MLDLACGRGGYGLAVAHRSGARLVGVDFSGEAVRQARQQAHRLGRAAVFHVGELTATGLADASVDAVMCIDAVQFAGPSHAVYQEIRRILTPGGRVVLTCWEPVDPSDERLPERLRAVDLRAGLSTVGLVDVIVEDRPDWQAAERGLWREAAAPAIFAASNAECRPSAWRDEGWWRVAGRMPDAPGRGMSRMRGYGAAGAVGPSSFGTLAMAGPFEGAGRL